MIKTMKNVGEFGFIDLIKKYAPEDNGVVHSIGDDTAVLPGNREEYTLLATDALVEDVHFLRKMGGKVIGRKALAANVSDIVAMGGVPTYAVVTLAVPKRTRLRFVEDIYKGMHKLAQQMGVSIVGGDTVASEEIIINVALMGKVRKRNLCTREGAKAGDWIFVSGPLGKSYRSGKHANFIPRLKESQYLVKNYKPTSMIDVSDGLIADLGHILKAGKVGALLNEGWIPLTPTAKLRHAFYDGEDFELLFTLPADKGKKLLNLRKQTHTFHQIGEVIAKPKCVDMINKEGDRVPIPIKGFTHF